MASQTTPGAHATVGRDGLLYRDGGALVRPFVDNFQIFELNFPGADVILLRLYEQGGAESQAGARLPPEAVHQVRMSAATARRLAADLVRAADEMEGISAPRQ